MGGDLTLESTLGEGSTFTVEWLAPATSPPEKDPYSPRENRDLVGKKALGAFSSLLVPSSPCSLRISSPTVVDENVTSRTVLAQLARSFGLTAQTPVDVADAYNVAVTAFDAGKPFDVVIIDAFLPGFAAQILLRRLRQKGLNAPAIALTRMGSPIYEEMRQLDCKFLIKPIKRNRLHHTLRLVFPAGESPRPSSPMPTVSPVFPTNLATRNPLSILCAEDNPINVRFFTSLPTRPSSYSSSPSSCSFSFFH
jgi:CheY-like chemotaxis protein